MGMPTEIRLRVCHYAIVKHIPLRPRMSREQYEYIKTRLKSIDYRPPQLERFMLEAKESKTKFSNIFSSVCRQTRQETGKTFFHDNSFRVSPEDLCHVLTHHHGPTAIHVHEMPHPLSQLKHLTGEIPFGFMDSRNTRAKRLESYINLSLPELQTLTLVPWLLKDSLSIRQLSTDSFLEESFKRSHRNLLLQVVMITYTHPILKKAIWCEGSSATVRSVESTDYSLTRLESGFGFVLISGRDDNHCLDASLVNRADGKKIITKVCLGQIAETMC